MILRTLLVSGIVSLFFAGMHDIEGNSVSALEHNLKIASYHPGCGKIADNGGATSSDREEVLKKAAIGMRSLGEAIHESKREATKIVMEFKREKMEVPNDAVVMGPVIIPEEVDPNLPPKGEVNPARAKWLAAYVSNLGKNLELLELETGRALLPAEKQSQIDPLWTKMEASIEEARQHFLALQTLVKDLEEDDEIPRKEFYNNGMHVIAAMKKINDLRGQIYKVCKETIKEDKASS